MPTVAKMNASGTARPMSPAGATPLSAIAAVGAMMAIDSAMASQMRSSRRRPGPCAAPESVPASTAMGPSLVVEDRFRQEGADDPVRDVHHLVDAQVHRDGGDG